MDALERLFAPSDIFRLNQDFLETRSALRKFRHCDLTSCFSVQAPHEACVNNREPKTRSAFVLRISRFRLASRCARSCSADGAPIGNGQSLPRRIRSEPMVAITV